MNFECYSHKRKHTASPMPKHLCTHINKYVSALFVLWDHLCESILEHSTLRHCCHVHVMKPFPRSGQRVSTNYASLFKCILIVWVCVWICSFFQTLSHFVVIINTTQKICSNSWSDAMNNNTTPECLVSVFSWGRLFGDWVSSHFWCETWIFFAFWYKLVHSSLNEIQASILCCNFNRQNDLILL